MADPLYHDALRGFLDSLVPARHEEIRAMEAHAEESGFPIVGPASAQLLYILARLMGARRVFELGSGYGYSTAWFCRAVSENGGGEVHHVVWDEGLSARAREHLGRLGYGQVGSNVTVHYTVGEAVGVLRETDGPFDVMFNDIDKVGYPGSIEVIEQKLRPGGLLVIDNVLWSGGIFDEANQDPPTQAIREVNRMLSTSPRWEAQIVPIRDGLMVARFEG